MPAFVTGGYLPNSMRGEITSEMIHVTDWYSTFVNLAKENKATETEMETDGFDVADVIFNGGQAERDEFLVNVDSVNCDGGLCGALRYKNYKLIIGGNGVTSSVDGKSDCFWTREYMSDEKNENGKLFISECGVVPDDVNTKDCGCMLEACLYDLDNDPCEYYDLSQQEEYSEIYETMYSKLKVYYENQVHPLKDIYATDYDNANPELFDNFWSPWLTQEQALKKQQAQYVIFESKLNGLPQKDDKAKTSNMNGSFNLSEDVIGNSSVWIVITFILVLIGFTFIACRAKRRFERYFSKNTSVNGLTQNRNKSNNVEQNPLLNEHDNSSYSSVEERK